MCPPKNWRETQIERKLLMKTLCLLPLLASLFFRFRIRQPRRRTEARSRCSVSNGPGAVRRGASDSDKPVPSRAVTTADKNLERNARANDPAGKRDPNADTLDARGQALEAITRSAEKKDKKIDGFAYQVKLHNTSKQTVEVVFWEYQFHRCSQSGQRHAASVSLRGQDQT